MLRLKGKPGSKKRMERKNKKRMEEGGKRGKQSLLQSGSKWKNHGPGNFLANQMEDRKLNESASPRFLYLPSTAVCG